MTTAPGRHRSRHPVRARSAVFLLAALLAWLAATAGTARTDAGSPGDDPGILDAAWTLFELGAARGDATLLASAAETVLAVAGDDPEARATAAAWLVEARFLARGEAGLLARIAGLESLPPAGTAHAIAPGTALAIARVPPGATVEISPAGPAFVLRSSTPLAGPPRQAGRKLDCARLRTGGLGCRLDPAAGPVSLPGPVPKASATPAFAFLATAPGSGPDGSGPGGKAP